MLAHGPSMSIPICCRSSLLAVRARTNQIAEPCIGVAPVDEETCVVIAIEAHIFEMPEVSIRTWRAVNIGADANALCEATYPQGSGL